MGTTNIFLGRIDMGRPTRGNEYDPDDLVRIKCIDENGRVTIRQVKADSFVNGKEFENVGTALERYNYVTQMDWLNRPAGGSHPHANTSQRFTDAILKSGRGS